MGFLADGADNPISNPSALEITRVVFERIGEFVAFAVLTLRCARSRLIMGASRARVLSSFYINTLLTFERLPRRLTGAEELVERAPRSTLDTYR